MTAPPETTEWGYYRPPWQAALCIGALRHRIARGAMKRPLRKLLANISPLYDIEIDGLKLRCRAGDNYTEQMALERNGHTNRTAIELITQGLGFGGVFMDIGANCGLFTLFAARKVGARGRVIAIEPLPQMLERLRFNIAANRFTNVTVVATAVGAELGSATIHVGNEQFGHSSMHPVEGHTALQVPVLPLLDICGTVGLTKIDALKIDIEGYEDRALVPFFRSAPRSLWPEKIFMEIDHGDRWETDCLATLIEGGYQKVWSSGGDALLKLEH